MKKLLTIAFSFITILQVNAAKDYLKACWNKQVKPLNGQSLSISYQEKINKLEHSFEPWQQTNYTGKGSIWANADSFLKNDTIFSGQRKQISKLVFNKTDFLADYGDKKMYPATKDMFLDQTFLTARYLPINIINYFYQQKIVVSQESTDEYAIYKTTINKTIVKLFIRKKDAILSKVTTLNDDDLFGDVLSTFVYKDFVKLRELDFPKKVEIEKINGKLQDEVIVTNVALINELPTLLEKPAEYVLKETVVKAPEIKLEKYNDNIHFLELKHTDDKVMIVEFADFMLVAEAPINSKNGELIISEARKIAPNKPIKYFVFGHYHPHYLGGIRPFIANGTKIICSKGDEEYVDYLAKSAHTLNSDELQLNPKSVQFESIKDSLTIGDGKMEMKIYFIGKKSEHTVDYLVYYFPKEKLLFQDDLVWIARQGEIKKASARQAGLYNAVKSLGLDIKTIIQSWPVADYGVKTVIPFEDLEKSMNIK
jgi:hypothetical protein